MSDASLPQRKRKHIRTGKPKGHWTRGRRRHEDRGDWSAIRLQLDSLFSTFSDTVMSRRRAAAELDINDRTLRRYLDGTCRPSPATQDRILAWLTRTRRQLGLTDLPLTPTECKHLHPSSDTPEILTTAPRPAKRWRLSNRQRKELHRHNRLVYLVIPTPQDRQSWTDRELRDWILSQLDVEDAVIADCGASTVHVRHDCGLGSDGSTGTLGQIANEDYDGPTITIPVVRVLLGRGAALRYVHRGATTTRPQWPAQFSAD